LPVADLAVILVFGRENKNMKKILLFLLIFTLSFGLFGCGNTDNSSRNGNEQSSNEQQTNEQQQTGEAQQPAESEDAAVTNLVREFGGRLKLVSLHAPKEELEKSIKENYGAYVTEKLIEKWINDPMNAPGRLVSSPWPERIEILSAEKISENGYSVKGEIIEITSTEVENDGVAAKRPITLTVIKDDGNWKIDGVLLGDYK